jgi:SNF2 family DNA or RNA helicase
MPTIMMDTSANNDSNSFQILGPNVRVQADYCKRDCCTRYHFVIINYDKFKQDKTMAKLLALQGNFKRMVLDEGHKAKNNKSKTYKNLRTVNADIIWYVTGKPTPNM